MAAVLFENNFFKLSAQTICLGHVSSTDFPNVNNMSNSSRARKIRIRAIFNVRRDAEYKTPAFAKNQSLAKDV